MKRFIKFVRSTGITRYRFIQSVRNALFEYLQSHSPEKCVVKGHIMYLGKKDVLELSLRGEYEPEETNIFLDNIKEGDTVLTIGAHIGYYALLAARAVGERGKVFAFEPEPSNFMLLKKNIETNGYRNVVAIQKAVSDRNGKARLYLSNGAGNSLFIVQPSVEFIEVDTIRLDDFSALTENIRGGLFIEMDIELSEPAALRGMHKLLKDTHSVKILAEFRSDSYSVSGESPDDFTRELKDLGFSLKKIGERTIFCERKSNF